MNRREIGEKPVFRREAQGQQQIGECRGDPDVGERRHERISGDERTARAEAHQRGRREKNAERQPCGLDQRAPRQANKRAKRPNAVTKQEKALGNGHDDHAQGAASEGGEAEARRIGARKRGQQQRKGNIIPHFAGERP